MNKPGELVVKPIAGRNLTEKEIIGKQDVLVEITCDYIKQQTRVDKHGGRKPQWNDVLRFEIKEGRDKLNIKAICSGLTDRKLIGETILDLKKVLRERKHDGWFEIKDRGKYAGDLYLELTFYPEVKVIGVG
jgi:Ca2+-dependent lipid-binding protein